jgi:DNA replication protein DnaC
MNTLQDRLDDFITNKPSFITNCDKHGDSVIAYANSKCIACEEDAKRIKIEKDILKYKQELINLANIPKRYLNKDFNNYEELSEEHKIFKYQIEHHYNKKQNLIIAGNTGTGKTHLAIALFKKLIMEHDLNTNTQISKMGYYTKYYNLASLKIESYKLFNEVINCNYLIIDEFGTNDSDFKERILFEIIDKRYDNYLSTILITNATVKEFKNKLTDMTYSRIRQNALLLETKHQDYRINHLE